MEAQVSEILENILGLIGLEGSFEVIEEPEAIQVLIETDEAGTLIGYRGETLDALQLLVNQILARKLSKTPEIEFKRVLIDVAGWRKNKGLELEEKAKKWAEEVLETGKSIDLEPMPAWQRRIIHMVIGNFPGIASESQGEGRDRHLVISPALVKKSTEEKEEEDS